VKELEVAIEYDVESRLDHTVSDTGMPHQLAMIAIGLSVKAVLVRSRGSEMFFERLETARRPAPSVHKIVPSMSNEHDLRWANGTE